MHLLIEEVTVQQPRQRIIHVECVFHPLANWFDGLQLAGEDLAGGWLRTALRDGVPIDVLRRWLFAPLATPPVADVAPRKVICNCFDVSEEAILQGIATGADITALQGTLKCGTSCGSCLPEVRRLVALHGQATLQNPNSG